jgi:hypothetical protein
MLLLDRVVVPLRVLLALLFAGLLVGQLLSVPGQFSDFAESEPGLQPMRVPLLVFVLLELVAMQIVIVCIWRLLGLVRADRIFSEHAFVWVDAIVWTMVAAWVLLVVVFGTVIGIIYFTPALRDPGTPMLLAGVGLVGGVVVLLMTVMRALLRQAAALRTDLESVI